MTLKLTYSNRKLSRRAAQLDLEQHRTQGSTTKARRENPRDPRVAHWRELGGGTTAFSTRKTLGRASIPTFSSHVAS
jgi:hypothetical protein